MFWLLLPSLAGAGELVVTTITPVIVKVDGTPLDYVPGTLTVQVSGMSGIHKVEIASMSGQTLHGMNVNIPAQGGVGLAFDGRNLVFAGAGTQPGPAPAPAAPVEAPAPAAPTAMDAAKFASLQKAVKSASFGDDKVAAVRTAAAGNWFTIGQVGALVDLASFGDDKVAIVAACRSKVVDPENAFQLSTHFSFSSDRERALAMFQ